MNGTKSKQVRIWIFSHLALSSAIALFIINSWQLVGIRNLIIKLCLSILVWGIFAAFDWKSDSPWYLDFINPGLFYGAYLLSKANWKWISLIDIFYLVNTVFFLTLLACVLSCGIRTLRRQMAKTAKKYDFPFFPTLAILSFSTFLLFSALTKAREDARKIACVSPLKQMGLALRLYSNFNNDLYPEKQGAAGLEELRASGYLECKPCYTCPSDLKCEKSNIKNGFYRRGNNEPLTEKTVSYIYIGGMGEATSVDSGVVMDKPDNHDKYGQILFNDGHAKGFSGADWMMNAGLSKRKIDPLRKQNERKR
jgi:hypothetical protein